MSERRDPGPVRTSERDRFLARLADRPLVADGATGTLLFSRGIPQRACLDELVLTRPDLVGTIHREYLDAGADIVETATFGANRVRLAGWGLGDLAARLNRRAAQLAREARDVAGRDALVAGSIGPLGRPAHGDLGVGDAAARAAFREQLDGLLEGGVDLLILETFHDIDQLLLAIGEVRAATGLPVVASMTFGEELGLADGRTPGAAAAVLAGAGVDVIGVNCGVGPSASLDALGRMDPGRHGLPGSFMPNAGLPQRIEGQFVYAADPAWFGEVVPLALATGARIVGGCCGTTPAHVAAMRAAVDRSIAAGSRPGERPSGATQRPALLETPRATPPAGVESPAVDAPAPTPLLQKLRAGRYVISVEIDPPRSIRIERTVDAARLLAAAGTDCVNISDSAMARVRMGALAVAFGIQHDLDLECVVHLTTRDRNLMALESELLGAHALGVRNILALTGDPPRVGDYPTGTGVWDVDSVGLVRILARLNRGEDEAGAPIGGRAGFTIACALDPTAADPAREWDRLAQKLEAGAQLVMTQPLYDAAQVEVMLAEARRRFGPGGFPVPVLLGVLPLQSSRHAEFLHHEVPGITIPEAMRAAMRDAGEAAAEVGLETTLALLRDVGSAVAGTYVMPSFGRYEQAAELVRRVRAEILPAAAGRGAAADSPSTPPAALG
jgi:methionine synthase I (cobalamin-dependent)/5,10-methylenetetrahydrofolate reductase